MIFSRPVYPSSGQPDVQFLDSPTKARKLQAVVSKGLEPNCGVIVGPEGEILSTPARRKSEEENEKATESMTW